MADFVITITADDGIDTRELTAPDEERAWALAEALFAGEGAEVVAVQDQDVIDVGCGCGG